MDVIEVVAHPPEAGADGEIAEVLAQPGINLIEPGLMSRVR